MTRLLPLLLLAGCPSPGLVTGTTGIRSQAGFTLNTAAPCVHAAEAVAIAERALPLALAALVEAGHARAGTRLDASHLGVCLIREPEPCRGGGWAAGPCDTDLGLCARKRGCASPWTAWASLCWPPRCTGLWPAEPHCTTTGATSSGWELALVHEVWNLARQRWGRSYEPDYRKPAALAAVEAHVLAAYGPARHTITETCP